MLLLVCVRHPSPYSGCGPTVSRMIRTCYVLMCILACAHITQTCPHVHMYMLYVLMCTVCAIRRYRYICKFVPSWAQDFTKHGGTPPVHCLCCSSCSYVHVVIYQYPAIDANPTIIYYELQVCTSETVHEWQAWNEHWVSSWGRGTRCPRLVRG